MKWIVVMFFLFSCVAVHAEVNVVSLKQIKQINKGLKYVQRQANSGTKEIRLKRYLLGTIVKKPLFFSSNDAIMELYMVGFLKNAHPYWLENDIFVFHTSSNKNYLTKLQRSYKRQYNIETVVYENKKYRKSSFELRITEYDDMKTYMDYHISKYFSRKNNKKKERRKQHQKPPSKKIDNKETVTVRVKRKKEVNMIYHSFGYLDKYREENNVKLAKYILYTEAEKPWFLGSMDKIYNLYLIAILNGAYPKWLEDEKFVFYSANNIQYLKRLKKRYYKKYHLNLSIAKVTSRRQRTKAIESDDLKVYMLDQIPNKYRIKRVQQKKKIEKKPLQNIVEEKDVRTAEVRTKREVYLAQKGINRIIKNRNQISTKLSKYILYKNVESPFFLFSSDPIYNLYLTGMIHGGSPKWLADTKFVMHTAARKGYLKTLQRFYQKRYHLSLSITKVPSYYNEEFALHRIKKDELVTYIHEKIVQRDIKRAEAKKVRLKKKRQKILQQQINAVEKALQRVEKKRKKLEEKKERLEQQRAE